MHPLDIVHVVHSFPFVGLLSPAHSHRPPPCPFIICACCSAKRCPMRSLPAMNFCTQRLTQPCSRAISDFVVKSSMQWSKQRSTSDENICVRGDVSIASFLRSICFRYGGNESWMARERLGGTSGKDRADWLPWILSSVSAPCAVGIRVVLRRWGRDLESC